MNLFNPFIRGTSGILRGVLDYGQQKKDGSHDHRGNTGDDRTPAQKKGDKKGGKLKT